MVAISAIVMSSLTAHAAEDLRIGTVLSFSQVMGIYGNAIMDGMRLAVEEAGGQVAGRKIVFVSEDDKNDPKVALQLVRRLVKDEKVDFLVGPVGSHIVQAIREDVHRSKTFLLVANAGNDEVTRELCSPYIIRTSFSNWQWNYPLGEYAGSTGKRAAVVASNFVAGKQMAAAFRAGFESKGGKVVEEVGQPWEQQISLIYLQAYAPRNLNLISFGLLFLAAVPLITLTNMHRLSSNPSTWDLKAMLTTISLAPCKTMH
jgi:branched-chain amino acid transport system substrate-binding protein